MLLTTINLLLPCVVAWRPFLDPMDLHDVWALMLAPLAFGIAVVYKAVRLKTLDRYWPSVGVMTLQIVGGMVALAAGFYLLVEVYVKWMAG